MERIFQDTSGIIKEIAKDYGISVKDLIQSRNDFFSENWEIKEEEKRQ